MLGDLIRYTEFADRSIIEILKESDKQLVDVLLLCSHILNSQHIWLSRINDILPVFERFQVHSKEMLLSLHLENIQKLKQVLEEKDLNGTIRYSNTSGEQFEDRLYDVMFHVINHSTYHRGQVASKLKFAGITPPETDYIKLKRQGKF